MPVIINHQYRNARLTQHRLLARAEPVTIQHRGPLCRNEHSIHGRIRKLAGCQRLQQKTLAANSLLDSRRSLRQQKGYLSAGTLPTLGEREAPHNMAGSDLNSTLGSNNEMSGIIHTLTRSTFLTRELGTPAESSRLQDTVPDPGRSATLLSSCTPPHKP